MQLITRIVYAITGLEMAFDKIFAGIDTVSLHFVLV
jgi:hypothetical protein